MPCIIVLESEQKIIFGYSIIKKIGDIFQQENFRNSLEAIFGDRYDEVDPSSINDPRFPFKDYFIILIFYREDDLESSQNCLREEFRKWGVDEVTFEYI